jgi:hypothetical protein
MTEDSVTEKAVSEKIGSCITGLHIHLSHALGISELIESSSLSDIEVSPGAMFAAACLLSEELNEMEYLIDQIEEIECEARRGENAIAVPDPADLRAKQPANGSTISKRSKKNGANGSAAAH